MMATSIDVTRVNRRTINAIAERKEADTLLLKADAAYASFTEASGPVRISGGFTHATTTGKSQTGATVRIEIEPLPGDITHATFNVKTNFEIGGNSTNLTKFLLKNSFFEHMYALKISQFIGAIGEANIVKKLSGGPVRFHLYKKDAVAATPILNLNVVAGSVTHLQHSRTKNGLDIIAKVVNPAPPPPHFWTIFEVKTTAMHAKDVTPLGQYEGNLSDIQKGGIDYVIKKIKSALADPKGYPMDSSKKREMEGLLMALTRQRARNGKTSVLGFVIGQGIDENYRTINNIITPEGLQQLTLWFGSQKVVKDSFGIDIIKHSQVSNRGSFQ
ncbi:hypothetical protein [Pectobacterium parmentieri]|uniref:hypothetical protein n=1 Tax=Pectobacterium parmentieri TaxID=1905730 RepID=UPI0018DFDE75|nr:hypothetical protein [Pectobacterium parmentieri]MBI0549183.1 hypothetical protein [Pectobacterium parmentieri]MBI0558203.1 hypothetical protein [Pectobacterium parmentieri]MBI0562256.1 hypothetical protein [Pectobacterium parmentieri]